jgi:4-oxalocrotonate tautomerase family enzyme
MPLVRVSALAGKSSPETKKKICQEIHEVMKRYTSAPDEAIWVVIDEVPADGWMMNKQVMSEKSSKEIYGVE